MSARSSSLFLGPWISPRAARGRAARTAEPEAFTLEEWSVRAVDVRARRPVEIGCLAGELLVTFEGDLEDHILRPGERFRMARAGRLVVAGLRPSRVEVRVVREVPRRLARAS